MQMTSPWTHMPSREQRCCGIHLMTWPPGRRLRSARSSGHSRRLQPKPSEAVVTQIVPHPLQCHCQGHGWCQLEEVEARIDQRAAL